MEPLQAKSLAISGNTLGPTKTQISLVHKGGVATNSHQT